jgi:hypothetical protein
MLPQLEWLLDRFRDDVESLKPFMFENRSTGPWFGYLIAAAANGDHISESIINQVEPFVEDMAQRIDEIEDYLVAIIPQMKHRYECLEYVKWEVGYYPPGVGTDWKFEADEKSKMLEQARQLSKTIKANWELVKTKLASQRKEEWKAKWAMVQAKRAELDIPPAKL